MAFNNLTPASSYLTNNTGANTGWLFYRKYYYPPNQHNYRAKNDQLERQNLRWIPNPVGDFAGQTVRLKTNYPGLLIGSGYLHEVKEQDEAIKIGFYFDHTTGMPVIPGSSVKGALRSTFPQFNDDEFKIEFDESRVNELTWLNAEDRGAIREALPLKKMRTLLIYILLFPEEEKSALSSEELLQIHAFELETFEGRRHDRLTGEGGENYRSIYKRDIFFDAVPVNIFANNQGNEKRLFGTDYLTPHKHKKSEEDDRSLIGHPLDPFSDPTPLKFFKVMPEVLFEFRFRLQPSQVWETVGAEKKLELFNKLLELQGVGAKTNVGYGHLISEETVRELQQQADSGGDTGGTGGGSPGIEKKNIDNLKQTDEVKGKLVRIEGTRAWFTLDVDGLEQDVDARKPFSLGLDAIGKSFKMVVRQIRKEKNKKGFRWNLTLDFVDMTPLND